ncbi:VanZ family protein [Candidatus Bipolaricaulota bacterium]
MTGKRIVWIAGLVVYAGAIFFISGLPLDESPPFLAFPRSDGLLHATEFAVFFVLARKATGKTALALLLTAVYAGSDELHQAFVPAREASLVDFGFDILGALVAAIARTVIGRYSLLPAIRRRILAIRASEKEKGN